MNSSGESRDPEVAAHRSAVAFYFVEDLAQMLRLSRSAVRSAIHRGEYGPYVRLGRRLAVRSESLISTLRRREIEPTVSYVADGGLAPDPTYAGLILRSRK